jgi:hypothetical protein
MGRACSTCHRRGAYRVLAGKPERRRPVENPTRRWENNTKIDVREVGWKSMDSIDPVQDKYRWRAVVNAVMNLRIP